MLAFFLLNNVQYQQASLLCLGELAYSEVWTSCQHFFVCAFEVVKYLPGFLSCEGTYFCFPSITSSGHLHLFLSQLPYFFLSPSVFSKVPLAVCSDSVKLGQCQQHSRGLLFHTDWCCTRISLLAMAFFLFLCCTLPWLARFPLVVTYFCKMPFGLSLRDIVRIAMVGPLCPWVPHL